MTDAAPRRPTGREWEVFETDESSIYALSRAWSLDPVWVRVLLGRGIDPGSYERDISAPTPPSDNSLGEMEGPRAWFHALLSSSEPVLIYSDLDVDGLASAAILARFFLYRRHPHAILLTNREDGRSLLPSRIRPYQDRGFKRIIVADMGASSANVLRMLQGEGMSCLVVDHHLIPAEWPRSSVPLVHPAGRSALTSAGAAYTLIRPYLSAAEEPQMAFLAGLSVLGDRAPLIRENRYLVLSLLSEETLKVFPGVRLLLRKRVRRIPIVSDFSFGVIPYLNAPGRMGDPAPAFDLLMASSAEASERIVSILLDSNRRRQELEWLLYEEIRRKGPEEFVFFHKDWFPGVLGRVAHRVSEEWNRTVFVGTLTASLTVRGSVRCRNGDRFTDIMAALEGLPIRGGGHPMAGGLEFPVDLLPEVSLRLSRQINIHLSNSGAQASEASAEGEPLRIDAFLPAYFRNPIFWEGYRKLFPFGEGFTRPLFGVRRARIERLEEGSGKMQACAYRWRHGSGRAFIREGGPSLSPGQDYDLVVTPEIRGKGDYLERLFVVADHRPA
ncbi:MAG: DHH family phosphoesterase [Leptospirillia bacterium]